MRIMSHKLLTGLLHILVLLLLLSVSLKAHTVGEVQKTCPLCQTQFQSLEDMSGTQFGMRLDLKPIGPIAAPWSVPVCPQCDFILFKNDISPEEIVKCKNIVASANYKNLKKRASYFKMGLLFESLNRDSLIIAHTYLKASWQEENENIHMKECLEKCLKHLDAYLKSAPQDKTAPDHSDEKTSPVVTSQFLKGEVLRRLAKYDDARKHFQSLQLQKSFQDVPMKSMILFELKLCDQKDSAPHEIPNMAE